MQGMGTRLFTLDAIRTRLAASCFALSCLSACGQDEVDVDAALSRATEAVEADLASDQSTIHLAGELWLEERLEDRAKGRLAALAGIGSEVRAQRLVGPPQRYFGIPMLRDQRPVDMTLRCCSVMPLQESSSTFLERFAWGAGAGLLALVGGAAASEESWVHWSAYLAGTTLGVILVTNKRGGARPLPTLLGATVGLAIPAAALAIVHDPTLESFTYPDVFLLIAILVATPIGAALAYDVGRR